MTMQIPDFSSRPGALDMRYKLTSKPWRSIGANRSSTQTRGKGSENFFKALYHSFSLATAKSRADRGVFMLIVFVFIGVLGPN